MWWWRRKDNNKDLERELRTDVELEAEEQRENGLSPEQAYYAARRSLGNATLIREEVYRMNRIELLSTLWRDLRHCMRLLRKSPGVTALSVLSLGLGIGLTAGMFSVGDAMLLRPMPFRQPHQLLMVSSRGDDGRPFLYGFPDYREMAAAGRDLAEVAAYQQRGAILAVGDETEHVEVDSVSPTYFPLLGVRPLLGQASVDTVAGRPQVVLGHRLWQRRFGEDPNVVGRPVLLRNQAFVVGGVMPKEFTGVVRGTVTDVWMSNDAWFHVIGDRQTEVNRGSGQFEILARLEPGVAEQHAAAVFDSAIRGPGKHKPAPAGVAGTVLEAKFAPNWTASVVFGGGLLLALSLVLFVACANVAQFRLAQTESRRKELAVRLAVGGGAWRVAGQLLVESVLLSSIGAGLGILLARFLIGKAAEFLAAGRVSVDYGIRLDYRVLGYTLLAVLLSVAFSGLAPVRHAMQLNLAEVLKSEQGVGPARGWHRKQLVIGQVAVSVALFGTAAMFLISLSHAVAVRPGLDPRKRLLVMSVGPGRQMDPTAWSEQVCERVAAVAGVRGATYARRLPLSSSGWGWTARVEIPGQAPLSVPENDVGGSYFALMGTRMLAGRGIDPHDRRGSTRVAVVSEAFARQVLPGRNPVGQWVKISGEIRQIVGIAEDGPSKDLHEATPPFVYLPYSQAPDSGDITLMVETAGEPLALARAARDEVKRYDPRAEVYSTRTLKQQMDEALSQDRMMASAAGMLGIFGVVLTGAGLFSLLLHAVSRRTREFGLRMALGARPAEIQRMVFTESLEIAAWGIPIGLALLAGTGSYLRSWLLGITPADPVIYVATAVAVLVLTLLAAWTPALRATHVDPISALRDQ